MSKKWKNKLKKQQKAQVIREALGSGVAMQESKPQSGSAIELPKEEPKPKKFFTYKEKQAQTVAEKQEFLPEAQKVKHDVIRIAYTMGAIIVLVVAATLIDKKTNWIISAADFLMKKF